MRGRFAHVLADGMPAAAALPAAAARVSVVGAGYVGLVTAACLAQLGHTVTLAESEPRRLDLLQAGRMPIHEPGLNQLFARHVAEGNLRLTAGGGSECVDAEIILIAVGTPSRPDGHADLTAVESVVRQVAGVRNEALLVLKSTVPPGTSRRLEEVARGLGADQMRIVSNPEFLREGRAVADFMIPDRIVIGARHPADGARVAGLYAGLPAPILHCRPEEAELAKYAANVLLAARVSMINELSAIADRVGADVTRIEEAAGSDPRIGRAFLSAGLGWGGSCFPKDVQGLAAAARGLGVATPMLHATIEANDRQRARALEIALELIAGRDDPRVALLGLAFKPQTDDVRESPALWLAASLLQRGVRVVAADPCAATNAHTLCPGLTVASDGVAAAEGADLLILATEWPEFVGLDWPDVAGRMRGHAVLDARNVLDVEAVRAAGLTYRSLGRDVAAQHTEVLCAC